MERAMKIGWYVLNDAHEAVPVGSLEEWAAWAAAQDAAGRDYRRVALEELGDIRVSTVFLGMDHNHFGNGPPLIFETIIFGGPHNEWQQRCSTWDEALQQHAEACALARGGLN
jgi:hypothetical protein